MLSGSALLLWPSHCPITLLSSPPGCIALAPGVAPTHQAPSCLWAFACALSPVPATLFPVILMITSLTSYRLSQRSPSHKTIPDDMSKFAMLLNPPLLGILSTWASRSFPHRTSCHIHTIYFCFLCICLHRNVDSSRAWDSGTVCGSGEGTQYLFLNERESRNRVHASELWAEATCLVG